MKKKFILGVLICLSIATVTLYAAHHESEALIELDKKWGAAQPGDAAAIIGAMVADDAWIVDGAGIGTKADQIAASTAADAPTAPYLAADYKVRFLDDDTAVMVHSVTEPDPHWSLHVWQKTGDNWQVVASISTPVAE